MNLLVMGTSIIRNVLWAREGSYFGLEAVVSVAKGVCFILLYSFSFVTSSTCDFDQCQIYYNPICDY